MKKILLLNLLTIILLVGYILTHDEPKTDLEIYTYDNIYYINDLTVTTENFNFKIVFKDQEQLKEYISNVTSSEIPYKNE